MLAYSKSSESIQDRRLRSNQVFSANSPTNRLTFTILSKNTVSGGMAVNFAEFESVCR